MENLTWIEKESIEKGLEQELGFRYREGACLSSDNFGKLWALAVRERKRNTKFFDLFFDLHHHEVEDELCH